MFIDLLIDFIILSFPSFPKHYYLLIEVNFQKVPPDCVAVLILLERRGIGIGFGRKVTVMDQQMNCPPWLDRLPGWSKNCDNIHNMQLHHIQEKHHHLQQISSPTNNSSNALNRLYANLHHLPTDIKLATVEVPPPSNIHRYTTLRTSISEQSQANQYLSTELTSLPPEKEQYAQVLRHAIEAAQAHAAHLLDSVL